MGQGCSHGVQNMVTLFRPRSIWMPKLFHCFRVSVKHASFFCFCQGLESGTILQGGFWLGVGSFTACKCYPHGLRVEQSKFIDLSCSGPFFILCSHLLVSGGLTNLALVLIILYVSQIVVLPFTLKRYLKARKKKNLWKLTIPLTICKNIIVKKILSKKPRSFKILYFSKMLASPCMFSWGTFQRIFVKINK